MPLRPMSVNDIFKDMHNIGENLLSCAMKSVTEDHIIDSLAELISF